MFYKKNITPLIIIICLLPTFVFSSNYSELFDKAIVCKEISKNFKSMYGFNFINENQVQILIKNSDTVNFLTNNILKYHTSKNIIYILGKDKSIHYGFNIFRENLNVWAFNVTALEPLFDGNQCAFYNIRNKDFEFFLNQFF